MAFLDLFYLDEEEYRKRISSYTTEQLVKQEVVKLRQRYGAGCSIAASAATAIVTVGATAPVVGMNVRRRYLASTKLGLIRDELRKRNI